MPDRWRRCSGFRRNGKCHVGRTDLNGPLIMKYEGGVSNKCSCHQRGDCLGLLEFQPLAASQTLTLKI